VVYGWVDGQTPKQKGRSIFPKTGMGPSGARPHRSLYQDLLNRSWFLVFLKHRLYTNRWTLCPRDLGPRVSLPEIGIRVFDQEPRRPLPPSPQQKMGPLSPEGPSFVLFLYLVRLVIYKGISAGSAFRRRGVARFRNFSTETTFSRQKGHVTARSYVNDLAFRQSSKQLTQHWCWQLRTQTSSLETGSRQIPQGSAKGRR
jgi:hypothetical protein